MNKARIEALSDGVFAIVMTLLVIEIKVPESEAATNSDVLWSELLRMGPLFASYFVSFVVIVAFWMTHHALFHAVFKNINRQITLLNMLYLGFLTLVPFSAHLVGSHPTVKLAVAFYGANLLAIGLTGNAMYLYAIRSPALLNPALDAQVRRQGAIRQFIYTACSVLGLAAIWVSIPLAFLLFGFPIVFNVIPGSLTFTGRLLGVKL